LHGGRETLGLRAFDVLEHSGSHVVLFQRMPDGHMGFPGTLDVWVTYRLQGATLGIDIRAKSDATTLCNITGHSYFNFTGAPTIADHQLQVAASEVLEVDETGIPSGAKMNVTGTQFDFQTPAALRQRDHPVNIDHNYCVSEGRTELRPIAWLSGGDTRMELASTEPGLQVYTGAGLGADLPSAATGRAFHPYAGIALEPQIWPDSPNRPEFAQAILRPDDEYHHNIEYRFTRDAAL
jgi:aldose 1-epimerase